MLNLAGGPTTREDVMREMEQNGKAEQDPASKEKVVGMLTESFASVRKTMEGVRSAGALSRSLDFFGTPSTVGGVLAEIDTHIAEHLGQSIAYARVNGIVPPWSVPAK
jgi:hypothetical protein